MTATDQRSASAPAGTGCAPEDPRCVEPMVEPIARSAIEIIRDARPVTALSRIVTPEISAMLARRASLTRRLRGTTTRRDPRSLRIAVTGVRVCIVDERTVEASAVLREADRARFLAMRWELRHTGWRVTVLEIG
ncbi:Rv3235 family protein [Brachybacterium hainanense]|uniref:Rv3235 family protein n=1 Tax=Brachybacterium hainanense TaxID=1541174 RepID=A0ABV6RBY1_9MICO